MMLKYDNNIKNSRRLLMIFLLSSCLSFLKIESLAQGRHNTGIRSPRITDQVLYDYLLQCKILAPEIVTKQAVLETGHFKSRFLMERNNLFGFRNSRSYIRFKSWKACVDYYKDWQLKYYIDDKEDYYHFLIRMKYAKHPLAYIKTLKRVRIKISNPENK